MTASPDIQALALELASARKTCRDCFHGYIAREISQGDVEQEPCGTCDGMGEVYVLPEEARVECTGNHVMLRDNSNKTRTWQGATCSDVGCRGWNPKDPCNLDEWLVVLYEGGIPIRLAPPLKDVVTWTALNQKRPKEWHANTPGLAAFAAAVDGVRADKVADTKKQE